ALDKFGSRQQKANWLPRMAEGTAIGCLADCEGAGELTAERIDTRFADGGLWGRKTVVFDGAAARFAIVLALSASEPAGGGALYLVDLDQPGVNREAIASIDPTIPL